MTIQTRKLSEIVEERNEELERNYKQYLETGVIEDNSISTGLVSLDSIGMLERGILTAVAAHTGDGKTTFSMQLVEAAAVQGFEPITCFFEDPGKLMSDKWTAGVIGESAYKLRKLMIEDERIGQRLRSATLSICDWAERVTVIDKVVETGELLDYFRARITDKTGLVSIDYAQVFGSEQDEKSVERVVARLALGCNELAKERNVSVVLYSQVKNEVLLRGKKQYDNWCFQNKKEPGPTDYSAVEGYRPLNGDMQWSTALGQRCKQSIMLFRPGNWLNKHGRGAKDNEMHVMTDKNSYGKGNQMKVIGFDGARGKIYDKKKP